MRYAIKNAQGLFYTHHEVLESEIVTQPMDAGPLKKGDTIGTVIKSSAPRFEAAKGYHASKFDTDADAKALMASKDDGRKPADFEGCTVAEVV